MSKGGLIAFRGSSAVAEAYLAGKDKAQDASASAAYLANQSQPFQHVVVTADGAQVGALSRDEFRQWAEHVDLKTGEVRGSFKKRTTTSVDKDGNLVVKDGGTPLYQETLISSSKSLSLAAAANPEIGKALEEAMERATVKMAGVYREQVPVRLGPSGGQYDVIADQVECTSIQHRTSRTGDPHMHRHVQFLTRALTTLPDGTQEWRAPNGGVLYKLSETLHAAADLSLSTDIELRTAIADAGFTWMPGEGGGKIVEFESLTDEFSQRRDQIAGRREAIEAQWRAEHPGQEPSPQQVRAWDNHGWSSTRPDKHELDAEAQEDQDEKLAGVQPTNAERAVQQQSADSVDAAKIADEALLALSKNDSAWSRAAVVGAVDRRLAETYLLGEDGLDDLRAESIRVASENLVNLYEDGLDIQGAKQYTTKAVLDTDRAVERSLRERAQAGGVDGTVEVDRGSFELSDGQAAAARSITGTHRLVVVEGAAGSGKTTMLSAASDQIRAEGRRLVAVSPTKRGAEEMAKEIGAQGNSVHKTLVNAGARFDDHGQWFLPDSWKQQSPDLMMDEDTVLVVDEAGMLDMSTAEALHRYCDDTGVQLVMLGDRKQLAAVGRGGYMSKAVHLTTAAHDLRDVRRFQTADKKVDQEYADASLKLREREDPEEFFDLLRERGQIQTGEPDEVIDRVAETVALEINARQTSVAIASTNVAAQRINHKVYEQLVESRIIDARITVEGRDGDPIAKGARVATRQNDRDLQVANRQTWTVTRVNRDGRVIVRDETSGYHTTLDADFVKENLQLAYAVTAHGAQGMTADTSHFVLSDQADAAATYVGLTRGRRANVLHAVAVDEDDAREQFTTAVGRQHADQGIDDARAQAHREREGLAAQAAPDLQRDDDAQLNSWIAQIRREQGLPEQSPEQRAVEDILAEQEVEEAKREADWAAARDERIARHQRILDNPPQRLADLSEQELDEAVHQSVIVRDTSPVASIKLREADLDAMQSQEGLAEDEADYLGAVWLESGKPDTLNEERARQARAEQRAAEERERQRREAAEAAAKEAAEEAAAIAAAEAEANAVPEQYRSGLRDLPGIDRRSESMQRRIIGLAELDERWSGSLPATDDQRRAFEQEVSEIGVGRRSLEGRGVRDAMDPALYNVLMQRVEQTEHHTATRQELERMQTRISELQEYRREHDQFGLKLTGRKIREVEQDRDVVLDHLDRLRDDRTAGVYTSRAHELDAYTARVAQERAEREASEAQVPARKERVRQREVVHVEEKTKAKEDDFEFGL